MGNHRLPNGSRYSLLNVSRRTLLFAVLLSGLIAGCGNEAASPTSAPTLLPSPTSPPEATSVGEMLTVVPTVGITPSGPAVCTVEPFDFPANSVIPPVTAEEIAHGPADAPITFIEYADFQ